VAFFDGEECRRHYGPQDGLHGSRRLAKTLLDDGRALNVRAVIVLDMVGDKNLQLTLPRNGTPRLLTAVFRAAEADGARDKFSLYATEILDDHQPFFEAGMPAVDIIDYEFGSAPGKNDYWHTPADTLDKLSAASLTVVGRVVVRMLNDLAAEPGQER
jgi:glutaminyl-peptide cyclotransferase